MDDELGDVVEHDEAMHVPQFELARFYSNLGLSSADDSLFKDASSAIRQKYRDCTKWKRLLCQKVSLFAERVRGTVYVIHVGSSVEIDWIWKGEQ